MLKIYENYMKMIGIVGNLMFYLQAYKIFTTKLATSISLLGFILSLIALTSWLIYGIILKNSPLIIANAFGVIGAIGVLIGIIIYS